MTDYTLTEAEWLALSEAANEPDGRGDEFQLASNVDTETDNVRVRRVGPAGGGLKARACVYIESLVEHEDEDVEDEIQSTLVYISAPEARQLAAALLNVADDIDGAVPLAFFPRTPGGSDEPLTPVEIVAQAHLRLVGTFAIGTGDTAATSHAFDTPTRVKVMTAYVAEDGIPCAMVGSVDGSPMVQIVGLADLRPQAGEES